MTKDTLDVIASNLMVCYQARLDSAQKNGTTYARAGKEEIMDFVIADYLIFKSRLSARVPHAAS